jgi:hypothetical protein
MLGRKKPETSSLGEAKLFLRLFCFLKLEVKFFQCVAVQPSFRALKVFQVENSAGRSQKSHRGGKPKLFQRLFCFLKLEVKFFQCVAVQPSFMVPKVFQVEGSAGRSHRNLIA